jgi:hypothetical protein
VVNERVENLTGSIGAVQNMLSQMTKEERDTDAVSLGPLAVLNIFKSLKQLYQFELERYKEEKTTQSLLKTLLGADEYVPTQELALRAEILGTLVEKIRKDTVGAGT